MAADIERTATSMAALSGLAQTLAGDGLARPRGLLTYETAANASYEWGKIGYVPSAAAAAFTDANPSDRLIDLVHALKAQYRAAGAFLMNDLTLAAIRKFKDGQGHYLWQPGLQAGVAGLLLGYPVHTDEHMPDVAAAS